MAEKSIEKISEVYRNLVMYDNFIKIAKSKGLTPYKVAKGTGISPATLSMFSYSNHLVLYPTNWNNPFE